MGLTIQLKSARLWRFWPKSIGGRLLLGLSTLVFMLLTAVVLIVASVWVENRYPSDNQQLALLPGVQRLISRPIVNAINRQIEYYIRGQADKVYMETGLSLPETIARFLDERVPLSQRRAYAYRLARSGSPECLAALGRVLAKANPEDKAYIAALIGRTGNPAVKEWLWPMLDESDSRIVIGALRGLSQLGGIEVAPRIAGILTDANRPEPARVEAALSLGTLGTPEALEALTAALHQSPEDELATAILGSLGRFEFTAVAGTFTQFLNEPTTTADQRVVAVEALVNTSKEAVPFLLDLAKSDADSDVRAAAAWTIGSQSTVTDLGPTLTEMARLESDVDVRRRLYESLVIQAHVPAEQLASLVQAEEDIAARVAGFNAMGRAAQVQPESATAATFDREMVPELIQIATESNSLNIQMRAVFALRRARTPTAQAALQVIADRARPQVATAARNGLNNPKS